ncbi:MAG TPA: WecB/TagA/CpsF family glycosyltransferase [Chloroflexota bacterium]|nr:WecB/TagA/CpsF family glycosyltransferase [Chloroflexota bacterium]
MGEPGGLDRRHHSPASPPLAPPRASPASHNHGLKSRTILGVRVDDVTYNEALERCVALAGRGRPAYVVTPNPEFVILARHDPAFRAVLNEADLSIPDGGGLLLAARLAGHPLREQVRGTDLAYGLIDHAPHAGWRVFLLGAAPGVAEAAARALVRRTPGLQISGTFAGQASPAGDAETVAAVRRAGRSDVLLVAYGARRQERWIARNLQQLDVGLAMGVGGVLDFMSGRVPRAPAWVRRAGVDWLFRLAIQPSRFKRQATTIPPFVLLSLLEAARKRHSPSPRSNDAPSSPRGEGGGDEGRPTPLGGLRREPRIGAAQPGVEPEDGQHDG